MTFPTESVTQAGSGLVFINSYDGTVTLTGGSGADTFHGFSGMGFDVDFAQAQATRARILDRVATEHARIAGMHLDFPCFGHVARAGSGYAFHAEVWRPTA